jgi:4-hydroxybenzoate polyprenyltransferase
LVTAELPAWRALLVLARPKLLPYVLLLVFAGYGWAHWDRALTIRGGGSFLLLLVAWTLLHAGTLWLNAALDLDEGEVLMGSSVPVPAIAVDAGYAALLGCVAIAVLAAPWAGAAAAVCAVLAALYSHPATAWKQHPVGGPLVNLVGYGLLSPAAGFAAAGVPWDARSLVVWVTGSLGVLGAYFAAQAFQRDEDARRGYRTLVVTHGPRATLMAGRICILAGFVIAVALAAIGWLPRVCLVAVPLAWWIDRHFAAWAARSDGGTEADARELSRRLLAAGLVALAITFGEYARASFADEPVAGLGTASGHPPDRPLLPPAEMRAWEEREGDAIRR